MVPPLRARTCDPSVHGAVVQVQQVGVAQLGQQGGVQAWPDAGLGPVPQPAPSCHAGTAHGLRRDVPPGDTGPQHEQDAGECCSVRDTQPPGMPVASFGRGWQQRGHPIPQVVRNKISTHPDTLPTGIVEYKTRGISSRLARRVWGHARSSAQPEAPSSGRWSRKYSDSNHSSLTNSGRVRRAAPTCCERRRTPISDRESESSGV